MRVSLGWSSRRLGRLVLSSQSLASLTLRSAGVTMAADLSTNQAPVISGSVTENLKIIHERMHQAFEGSPDIVRAVKMPRLVAVSKLKSKELIIEAYEAGQRCFGENYVQELFEKSTDPDILTQCPEISWHFIGHCQSSNVNKLLKTRNLALMETVSTSSLADKLQARCAKEELKLNILVQVNTSGEDNKSGVEPGTPTLELIQHIVDKCPNLDFKGVMTIGAFSNSITDHEKANPDFVKLKETRQKVAEVMKMSEQSLELSMGMSHDYEEAVRIGSTNVRVGSSIFGARDKR
ncbi:hypothetical protein TCAL_12880 [Tigriopus californicus]|uniref:Pyridoxal phosphate homeostasis protein n=1 Tax=Tigriopus californicus TaxID=6832 RepID=A0A553PI93_TIGCA|nr:pyridoxal phosphate homeostasis protein-like [Tigriopus californicus]TRY77401.1 hypothetical protein TCAL_12880 [Tigriopus californicus]|eukprot:TCALIF_12880-PA protein Name:"Similar to PROSC Proline synthase co-transcribed bacterial homolog protein (Homo sapiens)" AED:0.07 eAED:0.07 QI:408/1/1/1/0.5/0.66/3/570/292